MQNVQKLLRGGSCRIQRLAVPMARPHGGVRQAVGTRKAMVVQAASLATSTSRALTSDDKLSIIELCHRFDHLINQHDQEALGALFAPDGAVHTPKASVRGAPEVVAYFKTMAPMAQGNRHLTCNVVVEAGPEEFKARASSYRLLHRACMPPALLASGTIEDELVWQEGSWKFASRRFVMDPPAAAPAAAA